MILPLAEGEPIHVVVEAPEGVVVRHVWVNDQVVERSAPHAQEGPWRIPGMPPGRWRVHASGTRDRDDNSYSGWSYARPGETVRITLERDD